MLNFAFGALVAWFVVSFIEEYTHICGVLELPMIVMNVILEIIIFPLVLFWRIFLRHTIRPVELERIQNLKLMDDSTHLFGSIYFCHDKTAKRIVNKFFFYRVIRG